MWSLRIKGSTRFTVHDTILLGCDEPASTPAAGGHHPGAPAAGAALPAACAGRVRAVGSLVTSQEVGLRDSEEGIL